MICVDTLQNVEQKFPKEMFETMAKKLETNLPATMGEFMPMMFDKSSDPALVKWAMEQVSKTDPTVAASLMRNMADIDYPALLSGVKAPIRCINAEISPPMGVRTAVDVNKKYADFDVITMKNVGHFPHLEKPEEFNLKLQQTLDALLIRSP